ncbi:glycosyltransferase family 2 protein [Pseudomonas sp. 137P]|uniref:Glycosyltransferase family 2 protein n=1 Tax=Pseudomonas carassii TaxID=3115855 RepID=A0ABU7HDR0_9PSED|nr:glycosyltransferase family 2 protein [Pseudomonas sp. 137P]
MTVFAYTGMSSNRVDQRESPVSPAVAILMATYNGGGYLREQLDSFEHQSHKHWVLHVSDDGSTDDTLKQLEAFGVRCGGKLQLVQGPRRGYVANFLSLVCRVKGDYQYYAWSDQDDIWNVDKLERAVARLATVPESVPALYCARTQLVDAKGAAIGFSPRFLLPPTFSNALVQSIGGGNTMVFNRAACELLREAGMELELPSHDWWAYQLVSGVGGRVFYDEVPVLLYRQHDGNLIGSNSSWQARLVRIRLLLQGRFCEWSEMNVAALEAMRHRLNSGSQQVLADFMRARKAKLPLRLLLVLKARLYRQTLFGNLGLMVAVLLKKI